MTFASISILGLLFQLLFFFFLFYFYFLRISHTYIIHFDTSQPSFPSLQLLTYSFHHFPSLGGLFVCLFVEFVVVVLLSTECTMCLHVHWYRIIFWTLDNLSRTISLCAWRKLTTTETNELIIVNSSSAGSKNSWASYFSMLEFWLCWSCTGLAMQCEFLWVHECNNTVKPNKYCFAEEVHYLRFLQYSCPVLYSVIITEWALGERIWYRYPFRTRHFTVSACWPILDLCINHHLLQK